MSLKSGMGTELGGASLRHRGSSWEVGGGKLGSGEMGDGLGGELGGGRGDSIGDDGSK